MNFISTFTNSTYTNYSINYTPQGEAIYFHNCTDYDISDIHKHVLSWLVIMCAHTFQISLELASI